MKKVSWGDWALIAGTIGSGIGAFIFFIAWISGINSRVAVVTDAHAALEIKMDRVDVEVVGELRDINTRLSRMEGKTDAVLKAVK